MTKPNLHALWAVIIYLSLAVTSCAEIGSEPDNISKEQDQPSPEPGVSKSYTKHNKSSNTTSEFTLKDGKMEGEAIQRYEDGSIWKKSPYKNGKLHGTASVFYRDGNLKRTVEYSYGEKNGSFKKYFKSGNVKAEISYLDGLPVPGIIEYDYKGDLAQQPTIEVEELDQLLEEGVYYFTFRLEGAEPEKIYLFPEDGGWSPENRELRLYELPLENGEGQIPLEIAKGMRWQGKFYIYATYQSKYGLKAVAKREYNGDVLHF